MVDVIIIAFVVALAAVAVRSIARSFSAKRCAGCASGSHCASARQRSVCPKAQELVESIDLSKVAAPKGD